MPDVSKAPQKVRVIQTENITAYARTLYTTVDAGVVNVIYGSAAGLQTTAPPDQYWAQSSAFVREVSKEGDSLGVLSSFSSLIHPVL